tara:strand:- start:13257 stop:13625 length:369 start_codon:yes stop_codon:yes gene_type:complete
MTEPIAMTEQELDDQLPKPVGYRLLVALPKIETAYESGIIKAEKTIHAETVLTVVGLVVDMGEQCYADKERFPTGPWCKPGDYVVIRANSGTRIRVHGDEYRLLNDDSIEAVVTDPRAITRA